MSRFFALIIFVLLAASALSQPAALPGTPDLPVSPVHTSSPNEALRFLDSLGPLPRSEHWPNVRPQLFIDNIKLNIEKPASMYPGRETNFCGYGAISYLLLNDDPLGYARLMYSLYTEGQAVYRGVRFKPSARVKKAAGTLRFKGVLDIRPAEQLWYLCLADHYKGYLNFFNRRYNPGDENSMWAAVNYAKFNRMARQLLHYNVKARGSDLVRPNLLHPDAYINEKLQSGTVVLYLNNRILHKKKLDKIKIQIPTHYVVLHWIYRDDHSVTIRYWDYGSQTLRQVHPEFFKRLVFGISYCTKKNKDE